LPKLVDKEDLSYANSVFSVLSSTCFLISPAIGGILYKVYGSEVLFTINAISFLIAGVLFSFIRYKHVKSEDVLIKKGIFTDGIEGFKVLKSFINVKTVFIIMTAFAIMGRFYETFKVVVADNFLSLNSEGIIYFDYALAIGGLLVPLFIKRLSKYKEVFLFVASTIFIAIAYIGFGYSHNIVVTLGVLVLLGSLQNIQGIYSRTIIQKSIPSEYIGRVFSFYKIVLTLFALVGISIAAPLYNNIGVGNSFLGVGVILIALCLLYFLKFKDKQHMFRIEE
jgi:predicted MFS family arabinose efflux permease